MTNQIFKAVVCCICVGLAGCKAHITTPYQGGAAQNNSPTKPQQHYHLISNVKSPVKMHETLYAERAAGNYQIRLLDFQSNGDDGQPGNNVEAIYYRSLLPGPHKLVFVMPIWGSSKFPPAVLTDSILRESQGKINVIRLLGKEALFKIDELEESPTIERFHHSLKLLVQRTRNTISNVKQLVDWGVKQKSTAQGQVTIVGFSKASVVAGLLAQIDPNINQVIYVMGGSNPADMIYNCNYYKVKEKITKRFHWSNEKLLSVLHAYLGPELNVANYPIRLSPCRVLIFDSYYDKCIARATQDELWLGVGKPERISFLFSHKMSFGSMTMIGGYYMQRRIISFINNNNCSKGSGTKLLCPSN